MPLISPKQVWAHSVCSLKLLEDVLCDQSITAIETDVVMGSLKESDLMEPILSHSMKESDLSMLQFLEMVSNSQTSRNSGNNENINGTSKRYLKKHIKFDFKEVETVKPTIEALRDLHIRCNGFDCNNNSTACMVFLNADILPGPGMRHLRSRIDGDVFLSTCLQDPNSSKYAFSLGWVTDPRSLEGYTESDIDAMLDIIKRYDLVNKSAGIVLAVNARVLVRNCTPLNRFLLAVPSSQLLVWTATGEPPISRRKLDNINCHFEKHQKDGNVGYDCKIASNFVVGLIYDTVVEVISYFFHTRNSFKQLTSITPAL